MPASMSENLDKRSRIVQELMLSEESYLTNLNYAIQCYALPLDPTKGSELLSGEEYGLLFGKLLGLASLSQSMLEQLRARWGSWDNDRTCLGDIFRKFATDLRLYHAYVSEHAVANEVLERLKPCKEWILFCQLQMIRAGQTQDLASVLIQPVQRIPRYKLLLGELLKATRASHPDLYHLKLALEIVEEIAWQINDEVRERDLARLLEKLAVQFPHQKLDFLQSTPQGSRWFVQAGPGLVRADLQRGAWKPKQLFLFSDYLLIATPLYGKVDHKGNDGRRFAIHARVPINVFFVVRRRDCNPQLVGGVWSHHQMVTEQLLLSSEQTQVTIGFSSKELVDSWYDQLYKCQQLARQEVEMIARLQYEEEQEDLDEQPDLAAQPGGMHEGCAWCQASFTLDNPARTCQKCGLVVCEGCSGSRVWLPRSGLKRQRVCDPCKAVLDEARQVVSQASPSKLARASISMPIISTPDTPIASTKQSAAVVRDEQKRQSSPRALPRVASDTNVVIQSQRGLLPLNPKSRSNSIPKHLYALDIGPEEEGWNASASDASDHSTASTVASNHSEDLSPSRTASGKSGVTRLLPQVVEDVAVEDGDEEGALAAEMESEGALAAAILGDPRDGRKSVIMSESWRSRSLDSVRIVRRSRSDLLLSDSGLGRSNSLLLGDVAEEPTAQSLSRSRSSTQDAHTDGRARSDGFTGLSPDGSVWTIALTGRTDRLDSLMAESSKGRTDRLASLVEGADNARSSHSRSDSTDSLVSVGPDELYLLEPSSNDEG